LPLTSLRATNSTIDACIVLNPAVPRPSRMSAGRDSEDHWEAASSNRAAKETRFAVHRRR
jgi:hypothetical protein